MSTVDLSTVPRGHALSVAVEDALAAVRAAAGAQAALDAGLPDIGGIASHPTVVWAAKPGGGESLRSFPVRYPVGAPEPGSVLAPGVHVLPWEATETGSRGGWAAVGTVVIVVGDPAGPIPDPQWRLTATSRTAPPPTAADFPGVIRVPARSGRRLERAVRDVVAAGDAARAQLADLTAPWRRKTAGQWRRSPAEKTTRGAFDGDDAEQEAWLVVNTATALFASPKRPHCTWGAFLDSEQRAVRRAGQALAFESANLTELRVWCRRNAPAGDPVGARDRWAATHRSDPPSVEQFELAMRAPAVVGDLVTDHRDDVPVTAGLPAAPSAEHGAFAATELTETAYQVAAMCQAGGGRISPAEVLYAGLVADQSLTGLTLAPEFARWVAPAVADLAAAQSGDDTSRINRHRKAAEEIRTQIQGEAAAGDLSSGAAARVDVDGAALLARLARHNLRIPDPDAGRAAAGPRRASRSAGGAGRWIAEQLTLPFLS